MKIIFISFFYRPYNTVGSYRSTAIVNYLRAIGIKVYVITAIRGDNNNFSTNDELTDTFYIKWPNVDSLLTSTVVKRIKFVRYLVNLANGLLIRSDFPEGGLFIWRKKANARIRKIIKNDKIDLIYTSSGPASAAILGYDIKKKYNIPWIAEFRDPWTDNPYRFKSKFLYSLNLYVEKKCLKLSDHLIAINEALYQSLTINHLKPVSIIYNGFDRLYTNICKDTILTISYLGTIIPYKRDPTILFCALRELKNEGLIDTSSVLINFFCNEGNYIKGLVNKFNINEFVQINGFIKKEEVEEIALKSHAFLLLSWNDERDYATPAKLFEYIGFMKPIIAISYPGEIKKILDKTNSGVVITDKQTMKKFIIDSIHHINSGNYHLGFNIEVNDSVLEFSRENQTKRLVAIVQNVIDSTNSQGYEAKGE